MSCQVAFCTNIFLNEYSFLKLWSFDLLKGAKHPDRHPVFVELGDGGVEQVRDELPPGRLPPQLLLLRGVLRLLLPVLRVRLIFIPHSPGLLHGRFNFVVLTKHFESILSQFIAKKF